MNKYQKLAIKLARHEVQHQWQGTNLTIREYRNTWMKKFRDEKWTYRYALEMKKDYILWSTALSFGHKREIEK